MSQEPPPSTGMRLEWTVLPDHVRVAVERWLGAEVVSATTQKAGFSPGIAARLQSANGRRVFLKAVSPAPNPTAPASHRREAQIVAALPISAPVPRLQWTLDEGPDGWIVLVFEDIEGYLPTLPWRAGELTRVLDALQSLAGSLTPAPRSLASAGSLDEWYVMRRQWWPLLRDSPPAELDPWSRRHAAALATIESTAVTAGRGTTLLHLDLRADNIMLTPERVLIVDWAAAGIGAPWVDVVFFAPSVAMQGGPRPAELLSRYGPAQAVDPASVTAVVAAVAGFFTYQALQPAPRGLPTLRAFQNAQGDVARQWLSERTGLR